MPRMLREIIAGALSDQADLVLVDDSDHDEDWLSTVQTSQVDVVIASCHLSEVTDICRRVNGTPPVKLLAITDEGRRGYLCELRPKKTDLGELTPTVLLGAIREAVQDIPA